MDCPQNRYVGPNMTEKFSCVKFLMVDSTLSYWTVTDAPNPLATGMLSIAPTIHCRSCRTVSGSMNGFAASNWVSMYFPNGMSDQCRDIISNGGANSMVSAASATHWSNDWKTRSASPRLNRPRVSSFSHSRNFTFAETPPEYQSPEPKPVSSERPPDSMLAVRHSNSGPK